MAFMRFMARASSPCGKPDNYVCEETIWASSSSSSSSCSCRLRAAGFSRARMSFWTWSHTARGRCSREVSQQVVGADVDRPFLKRCLRLQIVVVCCLARASDVTCCAHPCSRAPADLGALRSRCVDTPLAAAAELAWWVTCVARATCLGESASFDRRE